MKLPEFLEKEILISLVANPVGFNARVKCGGVRFPKRFVGITEPRRPEYRAIGRFLFVNFSETESSIEPGSSRHPDQGF